MMTHFTSLTNSIFRQNEKSMVAQKVLSIFLDTMLCEGLAIRVSKYSKNQYLFSYLEYKKFTYQFTKLKISSSFYNN